MKTVKIPLPRLVLLFATAIAFTTSACPGELRLIDSPYRSLNRIDYRLIRTELDSIFGDIEEISQKSKIAKERYEWATTLQKKYSSLVKILPLKSDTGPKELLKLLQSGGEDVVPAVERYLSPQQIKDLPNKPINVLFAYRIFSQKSEGKKDVLLWANEHSNEIETADLLEDLTQFLVSQMIEKKESGKPISYLHNVIHKIFEKINLIIVPSLSPDLSTSENKIQDKNWFGVWLQPFNYDTPDPITLALAPEAKFFKELTQSLKNLKMGVDIHCPYETTTYTMQADKFKDKTPYIAGELDYAMKCLSYYNNAREFVGYAPHDLMTSSLNNEICKDGNQFTPSTEISWGSSDSSSYLSRQKNIPTLFLEMGGSKPRNLQLRLYLPWFIRLLELAAYGI